MTRELSKSNLKGLLSINVIQDDDSAKKCDKEEWL